MKLALAILSIPLVAGLMVLVFVLFPVSEHTKSVDLALKSPEVTHARILFVGDIMLDRYIRRVLDEKGALFVFDDVRELLATPDLTVGNLEGPITNSPSVSLGSVVGDTNNMRFTFAPPVASTLSSFGVDLVTIGNNHIRDFDTMGVESTKRHLTNAGIVFVGDPTGAVPEPVVREINGIRVAFVAYNEFLAGDEERALKAIREAKRTGSDFVVVLPHWGEEYIVEPRPDVKERAGRMSQAGADLIAGTHSHIIGAQEDIAHTRVYYSLGNFVFDQYWEESVRCGLAVSLSLTKDKGEITAEYEETKVGMKADGRTVIGCS